MSNWKATLVRGNRYSLGFQRIFEKGKPQIINNKQKEFLEENAVEFRNYDGEPMQVSKFEFEPISPKSKLNAQIEEEEEEYEEEEVEEETDDTPDDGGVSETPGRSTPPNPTGRKKRGRPRSK